MTTPPTPPTPPPGLSPLRPHDPPQIPPFTIHGRLGEGGMGVVYGATDAAGRWAAVKVVRAEYAADPEFRGRFAREIDLMRRVRAHCTVPVVAADPGGEPPWYATPLVPGPTLHQRVEREGALPLGQARALAIGMAEAVAAIHAAGIAHRDLKPANVILAPDGPKVLDFGIARAMDETAITSTGGLVGSPGWMSPERFRGHVGPESDVFAWGAMVAYAATGTPPFGTGAAEALMHRVLNEEPDLRGLPEELLDPVSRALAKDPRQRPRAAELIPLVAAPGSGGANDPATLVQNTIAQGWALGSAPGQPQPAPGREQDSIHRAHAAAPHPGGAPPTGGPFAPPRPKRGKAGLVLGIGAGAVALALIGGVASWFVLSESAGGEPEADPPPVAGGPTPAESTAATEEGGPPKEITIGKIQGWGEGIAVTHLWRAILEEKGYSVEVSQVPPGPVWGGLARGEVDLFLDAWLPVTHQDYWEEYGGQLEDVGTWYDNADLTVTVPEYVDGVDSLTDLKANADTFGGELIGIEAGSGLNRTISEEVFPAYGLKDAGFTFKESSTPTMLSALGDAIKSEEPVAVGLWRPHWVYDEYQLKVLEDPENAMGDPEELHAIGRNGFGADYPKLDSWLGDFTLAPEEIAELENLVLNEYDEGQADKAVEEWLGNNPDFLERTLGEDAEGVDLTN